jgi:hypothetical protein
MIGVDNSQSMLAIAEKISSAKTMLNL